MSLPALSLDHRQILLPEQEVEALQKTQALRQKVSRLSTLCCFLPCLPVVCCRVFCPWEEATDAELEQIRRCWNIGNDVPRSLPENKGDLFCQSISCTEAARLTDCEGISRPPECLYGPERQRMEELKSTLSNKAPDVR